MKKRMSIILLNCILAILLVSGGYGYWNKTIPIRGFISVFDPNPDEVEGDHIISGSTGGVSGVDTETSKDEEIAVEGGYEDGELVEETTEDTDDGEDIKDTDDGEDVKDTDDGEDVKDTDDRENIENTDDREIGQDTRENPQPIDPAGPSQEDGTTKDEEVSRSQESTGVNDQEKVSSDGGSQGNGGNEEAGPNRQDKGSE